VRSQPVDLKDAVGECAALERRDDLTHSAAMRPHAAGVVGHADIMGGLDAFKDVDAVVIKIEEADGFAERVGQAFHNRIDTGGGDYVERWRFVRPTHPHLHSLFNPHARRIVHGSQRTHSFWSSQRGGKPSAGASGLKRGGAGRVRMRRMRIRQCRKRLWCSRVRS
jgi:hypothetical protein